MALLLLYFSGLITRTSVYDGQRVLSVDGLEKTTSLGLSRDSPGSWIMEQLNIGVDVARYELALNTIDLVEVRLY